MRFTYDINGLLEAEAVNELGESARLLIQNDEMSEEEVQRRLKELKALKMHPRDWEESRVLIARGERLYAMTVGGAREQIGRALDWYQSELDSQEPLRIAKANRRLDTIFDRAEAWVGDVSFDEDWLEEDDEI